LLVALSARGADDCSRSLDRDHSDENRLVDRRAKLFLGHPGGFARILGKILVDALVFMRWTVTRGFRPPESFALAFSTTGELAGGAPLIDRFA
jgi:hypothetical protein